MTDNRRFALISLLTLVIPIVSTICPGHAESGSKEGGSNPPTAVELAGATYMGFDESPLTLAGGHWEGEPVMEGGASVPRVDLAPGFRLVGDLNGDGYDEAVVLLHYNFGGSGVFAYLAVIARDQNGGVENLATREIGDRVQLRDAVISDGTVTLETVEAGLGDGACCPGQLKRRVFTLEGSELVELSSDDLGRLEMSILEGVQWILVEWAPGEPLGDEIEIDLVFDRERITGRSGCNRYQGGLTAGELPGDLEVTGPLAGTRMACPSPFEEAERRYLEALQRARRFRFAAGRLAIDWSDGESWGSLTFRANREPDKETATASPSFDCDGAESSAEKLVCSDGELAGFDRRLAAVWERALADWPQEEIRLQKATQRGWIKGRDECWKADEIRDCVVHAYRTRIVELQIQSGQLEVPKPVGYRCAGAEEKPFFVTFYSQTEPPSAVVTFGSDQAILFRERSAREQRYAGPGVEFWETQGDARVDFFGRKLECAAIPR